MKVHEGNKGKEKKASTTMNFRSCSRILAGPAVPGPFPFCKASMRWHWFPRMELDFPIRSLSTGIRQGARLRRRDDFTAGIRRSTPFHSGAGIPLANHFFLKQELQCYPSRHGSWRLRGTSTAEIWDKDSRVQGLSLRRNSAHDVRSRLVFGV